MNPPEGKDQRPDVRDALRLRHEDRRELLDRSRVALEILLEIHVNEIGPELADAIDTRILRSSDARRINRFGENAEVGDAGDGISCADRKQRLCQRWYERDD